MLDVVAAVVGCFFLYPVHSLVVFALCWLSACNLAILYVSSKQFVSAIQDILKEEEEGGQVESKARVIFSEKMQLLSTALATLTGTIYWVLWLLLVSTRC